jgi:hypothetical protein
MDTARSDGRRGSVDMGNDMNLQQLSDLILSLPWKTVDDTTIVVEMPDDGSRYAVSAVRFDQQTNSVVIEVA